jgi:hypothetical protein
MIKIYPYPAHMELSKDFPLPSVELECPHCHEQTVLDQMTVDYPRFDKPQEAYGLCRECNEEITFKFMLKVVIEPFTTPPATNG